MKKKYFSFVGTFSGIWISEFVYKSLAKKAIHINSISLCNGMIDVKSIGNFFIIEKVTEVNGEMYNDFFIGRLVDDQIFAPIPNPIFT